MVTTDCERALWFSLRTSRDSSLHLSMTEATMDLSPPLPLLPLLSMLALELDRDTRGPLEALLNYSGTIKKYS